jgi:alpha-tubulin suppressor-like RCC1 family protein
MGSVNAGVYTAASLLEARAIQCPSERIVLAGYSQGAIVMHRLVNKLYDNGDNAILARIAGVVLMADGDRVPYTLTSLSGAPVAGFGGEGVASWGPGATRDITPMIALRTFSVCVKNDLVCDFRGAWSLTNYLAAKNVHSGDGYKNSWPVLDATRRVADTVRGWAAPTPPAQDVAATVGQPFRLQLVADARPGSVLRWRPTTLPAGLGLSLTGLISGTPGSIGTWRVGYQVQADPTGPFSDWIPGTVTVHTSALPAQIRSETISTGLSHSCAVTTGGGVKCWGLNSYGALGDGTTTASNTPVDVVGMGSRVAAVSAGLNHSCAVFTSGAVECWGDNRDGQLGNGTTTGSNTSVDVVGLGSGVAAVSAGDVHTCAVTTTGAVKCWGNNLSGQLGNGTTTESAAPVDVAGLGSGVTAVSARWDHSCAVTTLRAVKCWGANTSGQLGNGTTTNSAMPVNVVGLSSGVAAVSAGLFHSCAVTTTGAVKCWGSNNFGALGDGTTTDSNTPVDVVGMGSGVAAVSSGVNHSCASFTSGAVECWGDNRGGQLGNGTTTNSATPVDVAGLGSGVTALSVGDLTSCAVTAGGAVMCWGSNWAGGLGNGSSIYTDSPVPVAVIGLP